MVDDLVEFVQKTFSGIGRRWTTGTLTIRCTTTKTRGECDQIKQFCVTRSGRIWPNTKCLNFRYGEGINGDKDARDALEAREERMKRNGEVGRDV